MAALPIHIQLLPSKYNGTHVEQLTEFGARLQPLDQLLQRATLSLDYISFIQSSNMQPVICRGKKTLDRLERAAQQYSEYAYVNRTAPRLEH